MTSFPITGFRRITPDGACTAVERILAQEVPLAFEFNGIGYAVLMGSPSDIGDLITGFAYSERLITQSQDILGFDTHETDQGILLRVHLADDCSPHVLDRVRHRVADSSCGLCGIENLTQAMRPLPRIQQTARIKDSAFFHALKDIYAKQPLNRATGAMHAAALCSADGQVLLVREDVGRHNAFDKLIGAMLVAGRQWDGGFALLSSRCSYDLVEKAALAHCPLLATISAPTDLAVRRAQEAGLDLVVLAREDSILRIAAPPKP
ncbi:formate dehydrogenase accessory sulfurtransferase FdhD [Sphingobium phenoxybenzoativorans]|uniref:Sulfur carrier protein FdhD n=1 Tax=Sphingobium phenoxybenzoativorans TaxID=1592790 RepID=A0A975Q3S4_9SPHN|nr:formate dehydrogenase accessory sulfurtransferase FdhD [Sphingobium phenoxybenzoativorans]QUT07753.1 formate dehydrogenase accessory sulfurtransferase FdhD [Sphingobium phenoxybenzoativorans]